MLVALTKENRYIFADQELKTDKKDYFCPGCGKGVFYKKGTTIQSHFAHYTQKDCQTFSEGETREHIAGKRLLFNWFKQQGIPCQLEAYLPDLKQRPDLLIWLSEKRPVAIEFQCSPISLKRMKERTKGYQQIGYEVYWVLGASFRSHQRLTNQQRSFLRYHKHLGLQLYYLNVIKKELDCFFQIKESEPFKKISSGLLLFSLVKKGHTLSELKSQLAKKNLAWISTKAEAIPNYLQRYQHYLNQGRFYRTKEVEEIQKYLYQQGKNLLNLPKEVYFPCYKNSFIQTSSIYWHYLIIEWIVCLDNGGCFIEMDYLGYLKQLVHEKKITLYSIPQLRDKVLTNSFLDYLSMLAQLGLIEKSGEKEWKLVKHPYFYQNEAEKNRDFIEIDQELEEKEF
ncbi:competence protein CoiA [Carnobacterium gallinarum]|uniref:competence protein CoiA n=1 Tax=Carnobacterium gallinarum TaxID=2749 RepID=UPI0006897F11|nr:competence protein CoiA family protein [Carnobacterium gallinarum]